MNVVHGVDGCGSGWIRVSLDLSNKKLSAKVFETTEALFKDGPVPITGIDIPIGLPDAAKRKCDHLARKLLKKRRSSVFPVPMRAALDPEFTYKDACDANEKQCGKRLPQQSYAILPKVREVDKLLQKDANLRKRVYEVHPEVSFYYWNEEKPMEYAKKSGFGFLERYKLVTAQHGEKAVLKIREEHKQSDVADDDILDAIAAAWTARRINFGEKKKKYKCIPEGVPERDEMGLPMQMLA